MHKAARNYSKPTLAANLRAAAERQGLGIEAFRVRHGFSNGTFYDLLRGMPPRSIRTIQALAGAGVKIPANCLRKAA